MSIPNFLYGILYYIRENMEQRNHELQYSQVNLHRRNKWRKYAIVHSISISMAILFVVINWWGFGYITRYTEAIGWMLGLSVFGWGAYIDARIKMVPNKVLVTMLIAGLLPSITLESIQEVIALEIQTLTAMAITAGSIWLFGTIMSLILQKEALGEADIFPCAMVAGLTGSGIAGKILFLLTPYIILPLILFLKLKGRHTKKVKATGWRNRTLPLFPALYIAVYLIYPVISWIPYKILYFY